MLGVPYDIWMVVPRRILTEVSQGNYVYIYDRDVKFPL